MYHSEMKYSFKPNFYSFVLFPVLKVFFFIIIILSGIILLLTLLFFSLKTAITFINLLAAFVILLLFGLLVYGSYLFIIYSKTEYIINGNIFTKKTGTLLAEEVTEFIITQVTAFNEYKDFFTYSIFKTKNIYLQTSGTQDLSIPLLHVDEEVFENILGKEIRKRLNIDFSNDPEIFNPSLRGILVEGINSFWGVLSSLLIYIFLIFIESGLHIRNAVVNFLLVILIIYIIIGIISAFIRIFVGFINIYFTEYFKYKDFLFLRTGVLSKLEMYIPNISLTDTMTTQSFLEKIFGLHSITLSIKNNPVYTKMVFLPNELEISIHNQNINNPTITKVLSRIFRPNPLRFSIDIFTEVVLIGFLATLAYLYSNSFVFLLPGISFIYNIFNQITSVFALKYQISSEEIIKSYNLLTSKIQKLSKNNVTSIKISRDFFDRILKTASVHFYSLGGSETIQFLHVDYTEELENLSKEIIDYHESNQKNIIYSELDFFSFVINELRHATYFLTILIFGFIYLFIFEELKLIIVIFSPILFVIILIITIDRYFSWKNAKLEIETNFLIQSYGWWNQKVKILKNEFINISSFQRYPFTSKGDIIFKIAGDFVPEQEQSSISTLFKRLESNSVRAAYINRPKNVLKKLNLSIFNEKTGRFIKEDKPNYINSILRYIVFPPALVFTPFLILQLHYMRFITTENAYILKKGIFYKTEEFLFKKKIDHTQITQDWTNKYMKNHSVLFFTSGSEKIDMVFLDVETN